MKSESIAFAMAGIIFGGFAGYIIRYTQDTTAGRPAAAVAQSASAAAQGAERPAALLDEAKVKAYQSIAEREPSNLRPRVELGNLYFDAERYDDAIKWYREAHAINPKDPDVSTDLGVSYYYTNQPDRALEQFSKSLEADPKHLKTILNIGVVKAFGKQDLEGAEAAWQQVIQLAPDSPEGQSAKRALDSLRAAHTGATPGKPGA
jgi:tetratricopeptide (TPR) repeat protein